MSHGLPVSYRFRALPWVISNQCHPYRMTTDLDTILQITFNPHKLQCHYYLLRSGNGISLLVLIMMAYQEIRLS